MMKKQLLSALLLSSTVLFACQSNEKQQDESTQGEAIVEEQQTKLTTSEIEDYAYSQLPDTYDWGYVYSEEDNILFFVYDGFYLNLMDAQKYLETTKLETDWYAETNQMFRFNNRVADELTEMGYDGDVAVMIQDDYKETMFMTTTATQDMNGYDWYDGVYKEKGNGER